MSPRRYQLKLLEQHTRLSRTALADRVGISHARSADLARTGLTHAEADLYACRVGTWPWLVWPGWDTDPIDDGAGEMLVSRQPANQAVRPDVVQGDTA